MQRAHTPLGARVAAAAVARGRVENARSDHGAQSRLPQRLAPEAPSSVVWACEAAGEAGHRARRGHWVMRARTRGLPRVCRTHVQHHWQGLLPCSECTMVHRKLWGFCKFVCNGLCLPVPVKRHRGSRFGIARPAAGPVWFLSNKPLLPSRDTHSLHIPESLSTIA